MSTQPTAFEQAMLEWINLARTDPAGEFDRLIADAAQGTGVQANITTALGYFGVDPEAFRAQMAAFGAVAPLAWNTALAQAAETHTQLMLDNDAQSHQLPGEAGLLDRIRAAGYTDVRRVGENVYSYTEDVLHGHAGFMIDWGFDDEDYREEIVDGAVQRVLRENWQSLGDGMQDPPGHRLAIMSSIYTDIGIAAIPDGNPATKVGPWLVTQDFGARWSGTQPMLLGVFTEDADGDGLYDIGEGVGGITVTATGSGGTFTTTTWDAGGYQMVLPAGSYTVTFSGAGLAGRAQYDVTMGTANLKLDGQTAAMVAARATTGDDVLTGGDMRDVFIGLAGRDALNGAGGDDMLIGDTLHASWFAEVAGQVFRLYQATLGRIPDNAGQQDWTGRIAVDGMALVDVAAGFMGSREFQNTYGALEIEPFLDLLYRNVLGRDADVAGRDFWIREMILNGATRADVVLGFSESREFRNATAAEATAFTAGNGPAGWSDDVFRLYQATLDRAPDLAGFLGWTGQLGSGTPFLTAIEGFTGSREFTNTYGAVSDAGFVELLYQNVLGRAADAAGLADWIARLGGGDSRAQVVEGFAQSREFIRGTAADVTDWIRAQGTDDVLNAGAGTDVLAGGILADSFVFDPAETPGQKRVLDLEPWDSIDLSAFGYGSDAAARSHFSQQGADVVFEDQNVTVIFANTEMALISDEMILV